LLFLLQAGGVNMRKPDAVATAATKTSLAGRREPTPTELVCLALALAVVMLAMRIASMW
jgi:hypothetical protein